MKHRRVSPKAVTLIVAFARPVLSLAICAAIVAMMFMATGAAADGLAPVLPRLGVGSRLKGAPSTVEPFRPDPAPIYRPNCRWRVERHSDPNEGWTTRRVRVCD